MLTHSLYNANCLDFLTDSYYNKGVLWDTAFADPPDNIGLGYDEHRDKMSDHNYQEFMQRVLELLTKCSVSVWWSFNPKHTVMMGVICDELGLDVKPCVQTFTFGQYNKNDLGVNHRPLWRISLNPSDVKLYPETIKVPSWRELNGDKRAKPGGRVPGDVFDFPRVTGNSKQRRSWHPTQLNEGLVERCLKLTSAPGETVLDVFGGTGTTLRVCKAIGRECTTVELSKGYCSHMLTEHPSLILRKNDFPTPENWRF